MLCCNVVTNAQLVRSFQTSWDLFPAVLAERCISGEPVLLCQGLSADSAYICILGCGIKAWVQKRHNSIALP